MSKKKLLPKNGILIWENRSGSWSASYFDEENDFISFDEAINIAATYFSTGGREYKYDNRDPDGLQGLDLYNNLIKFLVARDAGRMEIVENEE